MTNKQTGGPAFPLYKAISNEEVIYTGYTKHDFTMGMTLLDFFAAKAMQALLSDPGWRHDMDFAETASAAYRQAAKMLKARDGQT